MNLDLYAADSKVRAEKMASSEVAGFAYINVSGRVQYDFLLTPSMIKGLEKWHVSLPMQVTAWMSLPLLKSEAKLSTMP